LHVYGVLGNESKYTMTVVYRFLKCSSYIHELYILSVWFVFIIAGEIKSR
jgi:hypothetical protein